MLFKSVGNFENKRTEHVLLVLKIAGISNYRICPFDENYNELLIEVLEDTDDNYKLVNKYFETYSNFSNAIKDNLIKAGYPIDNIFASEFYYGISISEIDEKIQDFYNKGLLFKPNEKDKELDFISKYAVSHNICVK